MTEGELQGQNLDEKECEARNSILMGDWSSKNCDIRAVNYNKDAEAWLCQKCDSKYNWINSLAQWTESNRKR